MRFVVKKKIGNIIKTARKGTIQDQDAFRRASMGRMSPVECIKALVKARNIAFTYEPLKKVARQRKLR